MIIKFAGNQFFRAGDGTTLKEVLHPVHRKLTLPYSLAFAYLEKDEASLLHTLKETEVYFIIKGTGRVILDGKSHLIEKGDCVMVTPEVPQSIVNTGADRLEFICVVSPPWTVEGERVLM